MSKRKKNRSFYEWMKLIRWENTTTAILCVFVAFVLGESFPVFPAWLFIALSVAFIFAGGNILNDWRDVLSDAVSHPHRPLPRGTIQKGAAFKAAILSLLIGIIFAFSGWKLYGAIPPIIATIAALLLVFYDFYGKRLAVFGNLVVATLGGLVFIYAGFVGGLSRGHFYAAIFAFLFHFGREIVKDIADIRGDTEVGANTLAVALGPAKAAKLALLPLLLIVPFAFVPFIVGDFSVWYLASVILFVVLPILLFAWILPGAASRHSASKAARELKWIMFGGLFALFLGGLMA